jgi:hypothetical protein
VRREQPEQQTVTAARAAIVHSGRIFRARAAAEGQQPEAAELRGQFQQPEISAVPVWVVRWRHRQASQTLVIFQKQRVRIFHSAEDRVFNHLLTQ